MITRPRLCAAIFSTIISALLLTLRLALVSGTPSTLQPRTAPIPTHPSPGFGFDLGPSYIAASIRYSNGTFDGFVFTNVSDVYRQFFVDSSQGRERCRGDWPQLTTEPQHNHSDLLPQEDPGHHPAVDILTNLIGKAKTDVQGTTGLRIDDAFVSSPKLPGLCNEDIEAALRNVGIKPIHNSRVVKQPHELSASYAAYGRGLCSDYTRQNPCEYEERWELPLRVVMAVTYSDEALHVEYSKLDYAASLIFQQNSHVDWQAGANDLSKTSDPWNHWNRVRVRLLELALHWCRVWPKVDIVILAGPHARNETFVEVVKDTFARFQDEPPELLMEHGDTTSARGAAELAFRAQYQR